MNWKDDAFFAKEDDYDQFMTDRVEPWVKDEVTEGDFEGRDQVRIHYYYVLRKDAQASIVFCHGYTEYFAKYHELFYYFSQAGYNVFFIEHRGFGHSQRLCENIKMAYVDDFDDYVQDMHIFIRDVVRPILVKEKSGKSMEKERHPIYLFAHSMGGCIGALTAEKYPDDFDGAVLSSPMFSVSWGGTAESVVMAMVKAEEVAGRLATYMPGQGDYEVGRRDFESSSGQSKKRYDHFMEIRDKDPMCQVGGASFAWSGAAITAMERAIRCAGLIKIPTVMFTAGKDTLVSIDGQEAFLKHNPAIRHIHYPESKHELFNSIDEIRIPYLRKVLAFYESL